MNSLILQIASKYIRWLLVFFAILALLRGHNHPGGGFIGGLLVALAIVYYSLAFNLRKMQEELTIKPQGYIALGMTLILISVFPSLFQNMTLMTGVWISFYLPILGEIKLGTPFLFDIGVFLAVIGVTLMFFFSLTRKE